MNELNDLIELKEVKLEINSNGPSDGSQNLKMKNKTYGLK